MILFNGKLYFFEGLNCAKKIHRIEDVLYWIENNYKEKIEEKGMERIVNYQKYHQSFSVDAQGSISVCESIKYKKRKTNNKIKKPIEINMIKK
jgi:hypothetical protein